MNSKTLKIIQSYIIAGILLSMCFIVISCNNDIITNEDSDLPYLEFSNNVDLSNLAQSDLQILALAHDRITITITNEGYFEIRQKSGKEVNISEELFSFILDGVSRSNDLRKNIDPSLRSSPIFEGDCFVKAIGLAYSGFGYILDETRATYSLYYLFGYNPQSGLLLSHFTSACRVFFYGENIQPNQFPSGYVSTIQPIIIVVSFFGQVHAGRLHYVGDNFVAFFDKNGLQYALISDILNSYIARSPWFNSSGKPEYAI